MGAADAAAAAAAAADAEDELRMEMEEQEKVLQQSEWDKQALEEELAMLSGQSMVRLGAELAQRVELQSQVTELERVVEGAEGLVADTEAEAAREVAVIRQETSQLASDLRKADDAVLKAGKELRAVRRKAAAEAQDLTLSLNEAQAAARVAEAEAEQMQLIAQRQANAHAHANTAEQEEELDQCHETILAMKEELESYGLQQEQFEDALAQEQAHADAYQAEAQQLTQELSMAQEARGGLERQERLRAELESERMEALKAQLQAANMQRDAALEQLRSAQLELRQAQQQRQPVPRAAGGGGGSVASSSPSSSSLSAENAALTGEIAELSTMLRERGAEVAALNAKLHSLSTAAAATATATATGAATGAASATGYGYGDRSSPPPAPAGGGGRSPPAAAMSSMSLSPVLRETSPASQLQRRLVGLPTNAARRPSPGGGGGGGGGGNQAAAPTYSSHDVAAAEALATAAAVGGISGSGSGTMDVRAQLEMQSQIIALRQRLQETRARAAHGESMREHHDARERKEAIRTLSARARRARLGINDSNGSTIPRNSSADGGGGSSEDSE